MSVAISPAWLLSVVCSALRAAMTSPASPGRLMNAGRVGAVTLPSDPTVNPFSSASEMVFSSLRRAVPMSWPPAFSAWCARWSASASLYPVLASSAARAAAASASAPCQVSIALSIRPFAALASASTCRSAVFSPVAAVPSVPGCQPGPARW